MTNLTLCSYCGDLENKENMELIPIQDGEDDFEMQMMCVSCCSNIKAKEGEDE